MKKKILLVVCTSNCSKLLKIMIRSPLLFFILVIVKLQFKERNCFYFKYLAIKCRHIHENVVNVTFICCIPINILLALTSASGYTDYG